MEDTTWLDMEPVIGILRQAAALFDLDDDIQLIEPSFDIQPPWMKRSADLPPQCALNPQDSTGNNSHQHATRDDRNYLPNRAPGRNNFQRYPTGQPKREPQCMSQSWPTPTYDNSNTSWEGGDWSGTPPMKTDPGAYYKQQQNPRPHQTPSYPSGSEWSPGESSASSSVASGYGMVQSPNSSSVGGSYYENNGYYSSGYNNYAPGGYTQAPNYPPQQPYQQQSARSVDTYQQVRSVDSYQQHNNRVPSSCPPVAKQPPMHDFQRRTNRYGMEGVPKVQIKQEPEEYQEMDGENFTSLFTKSLTSLYSQDTENAFSEDNNDPDIMILSPLPPPPPPLPQPIHQLENQAAFQRLHSSGGHYTTGTPGEYQENQNNFGFYETKILNCEPQGSVVQEIGSKGDRMNSFRYDRPSFDDMHLYASNSSDSKPQVKKRKNSMPSAPPENFTENRKKTSRMMSFKSESQWTPNSFGFDGIQIKQEPMDDYNSNELETSIPFQDSSPGSSGNGNSKTAEQPKDHPKQPPRKRSPGTTCFDRFDKKSTPTNKKVSPLSIYAKVQDSVILSVKCRRYKKRTKPITCKEEAASPGKEEMENYKRFSLTPDQAARLVMNDLLDRVSLFGERNAIGCTDLSQMEPYQLRDLFMQFCHRSNLDYRDFEDIGSVLRPRLVEDKMAKNSVRASAIRKRTSTSPVQASIEPPPSSEDKKIEPPVAKTRRRRKANILEETPFEKRVLRQLPGRAARNGSFSPVVAVTRRYSTRNGREEHEVDIVIDLSTDQEDEAGKEAEVRKKSQRLNNRRPARNAAVRDGSLEEENEVLDTRATSRGRGRQTVGRKPAREISLDKANTPTRRASAREQSLDKAVPTGRASAREKSLDKANTPNSKANSREQSLDKIKPTGRASARDQSWDKAKPTGRACARELSLDKGKSTSRTRAREQSLENVEHFEDTRRRTRSREKKVEVPMEIYKPPPRKRRSRLCRMSSNDSSVEIVDITRSSDSASPPLLDAIKMDTSASKSEEKANNKNTKRGGKGKNKVEKDSPSALMVEEAIKVEDVEEVEPPVLRRSVKRKRTLDAIQIEPPSLHVSAETTKRRNSIKIEPPSLQVSLEKIKTKAEIKTEPLSPTENDQKTKFETFNGAIKTEVTDYNLASSISQKVFKPKFEEIPKNASVKSGSSKRKQGGPTKFLKESFKTATFPTFRESSPDLNNLTSDFDQSDNKFCNSNLVSKFRSSKLYNNITAAALSEPANSSESLRERYRKSFCTEPLRNTSSKRPEEKPAKFNPFLKSNNPVKHLKESLAKTPALKSEHSVSNQRSGNSSQGYLFPNSSSGLMVKVKEEPLSEEDTLDPPASTSTRPIFTKVKTEKKPAIQNLPRRRSSQCSDSELQVVLTKLPDVQVNLRNGSVAYELVKKCEEEQERVEAELRQQELSDYDSDEEKPLMLLRNGGWKQEKQSTFSASNCIKEQDPLGNSSTSMNSLKNSTPVAIKPENPKSKRAADRRRFSESEDSDCGLVIDLDRRLSVEERVPSPTIQNSNTDEDLTETEDMDFARPEDPPIPTPTPVSDKPLTATTNLPSTNIASNDSPQPSAEVKEEPVPPTETRHSSLFRDATEEAHILLELSRGGMPPLIEGVAGKWEPAAGVSGGSSGVGNRPVEVCGEQVKEKDESILRTLLLENGDAASGTSQDMQPCTSPESKHVPTQDSMRLLSYSDFQSSSTEIDEKKMMDELQQNSDQMSSDVNANFLPASYEWCLRDPQAIREVIQKLKDEIRYLQCMAEERDRERTSIVCFKRYKEEILKRLLKKCTANTKDLSEWREQKNQTTSHLNGPQPLALTSTSNGTHSRLSSALTGGTPIHSDVPSATVTSGESYSSNSGENLPTVATMVANATENYGVDLRTVTSRRSASSSKTILQEALSSKEPIYRPVATRSPLPQNERPPDSVRVVQNSPLSFRSSSPLELPRTSHLSRRLLGSSSSQTSLQPKLRQSPFSAHGQHASYVRPSMETETRRVSPSPSRKAATPKCSPRSSPKSNSFPLWGNLEADRNSSIDLRINPGSPNFNRSRAVDPRPNHPRSSSVDPRAIHLPSNGSANPFPSSHRPASAERPSHASSNRATSIDLRNSQVSPNRPASAERPSHTSSNRATSIDLRNSQVSPNRPASAERPSHTSSNRATSLDLRNSQVSPNRPASAERPSHTSSNRATSLDLRNSQVSPNRPASAERPSHTSSNRATSLDLRNSQVSPNRPASFDPRINHSSPSRSNPAGLTNGYSSFMIVPPPTTLQSAFKERGHHRSRSESRSSDKAMNGQMERIYERRNDEDPHPRFVPLAGPLLPAAPSSEFPKCSGCGISKGRYVCSGCERQLYCSAKCQSMRWAEHSKTCSSTHRKENSKSYN